MLVSIENRIKPSRFFHYTFPIAIRINKKYIQEIVNLETVTIDIPENNALLSYNFFDYPRIRVSDGDTVTIEHHQISRLLRFLVTTTYFLFYFLAPSSFTSSPYFRTYVFFIVMFTIVLLPSYRFQKR